MRDREGPRRVVAADFRAWREARGWSRRACGAHLGVGADAVEKWERGINPVPRHAAMMIVALDRIDALETLAAPLLKRRR